MENPFTAIWKHIADVLRPEVGADAFARWFAVVELTEANEIDLTLCVPSQIFQLWIETNYMTLLQGAILQVLGSPREIKFVFAGETKNAKAANADASASEKTAESASDSARKPAQSAKKAANSELGGHSANGETLEAPKALLAGFNPRNTFDSFVVGKNNEFAHAAALAVSKTPAKTYNPLFIHGGVGLGKTHLMQAIGQQIAARKKDAKVTYLSSEKFLNEYIEAVKNGTLVRFRKKYRHTDVLLIDDIQFLGGKERSQEEFFHTFNTLFDGHKQIVLSSDRPPAEISNLEARLVSRFEWGLTAELQPPDVETRVAILRKKAQMLHVKLPDKTLQFLAERIRSNVRRLEGALMRVASFASLQGQVANDQIEHLLRDILQEEARRVVTIDQIQRKVAEHYDVRLADMTSKRRPANIAFPRQIAMYLARERTKASLSEIGEAFGGRDHGTVLHAHKLVKGRIANVESVRTVISFLDSSLDR